VVAKIAFKENGVRIWIESSETNAEFLFLSVLTTAFWQGGSIPIMGPYDLAKKKVC